MLQNTSCYSGTLVCVCPYFRNSVCPAKAAPQSPLSVSVTRYTGMCCKRVSVASEEAYRLSRNVELVTQSGLAAATPPAAPQTEVLNGKPAATF